ncbi:MAG: hypothetical protein CMM86_09875, partial [Rhodovulum sp.]|nr:hypothetical protein [Rhodovulum sp.]
MTQYSNGRAVGVKSVGAGRSVMARVLSALMMVMLAATLWLAPSGPAQAAVTDCPSIVANQQLGLNFVRDNCAEVTGGPIPGDWAFDDDFIFIEQFSNGTTNFTIQDLTSDPDPRVLTYTVQHDSGTTGTISNGSFANVTCNSGCTVSGSYGGVPFSFVYTFSGGSGAIGGGGDTTAPTVTSVLRQTPAAASTNSDTLVFRVTFDEDVQNVDTTDFDASGTTGGVSAVSAVSASVYDVTVSGGDLADLNGTVGLTFDASQNIADLAGNALSNTTPGTDETYTLVNLPEISVSADIGGAVADGGTLAQGNQAAGAQTTITFTVANSGDADLALSTATSSGASNVTVNSISVPASSTVAPGGSTTFTVSYTPTNAGAFSFDLSMVNDDGDENPYNVTVSGTATGAPEIGLSGSIGGAVSDGGTLAQGSQAAGGAVALTVTVANTGTDTLTLSTATSSGASNVTVNSISAPASSTVAPGGSTTFTVSYTPTIAGAFGFDLSMVNDDADENPYDVTVSGTATGAPEIGLSGSIGGAVSDGGTLAQGSQAAG